MTAMIGMSYVLMWLCLWYLYQASTATNTLLEEQMQKAELLYLQGNQEYRNGHLLQAYETYQDAIIQYDQYDFIWSNLGHVSLQLEYYQDAIEAYQIASQLAPHFYKHIYHLGIAYQAMNNYPHAKTCYEKVLQQDPTHLHARYNLAMLLQDHQDFQAAKEQYEVIIQQDSQQKYQFPEGYGNYCNLLLIVNSLSTITTTEEITLEEIEHCYLTLYQFYPAYIKGIVNIASFYWQQDRLEDAKHFFGLALHLEPDHIMATHGYLTLQHHLQPQLLQDYVVPDEYIASLFDSYASHFDLALQQLQYQVPAIIAKQVIQQLFNDQSPSQLKEKAIHVLDLGAGTGLVCEAIRQEENEHHVGEQRVKLHMTAVDLSAKMIQKARQKQCYQETFVSQIDTFLQDQIDQAAQYDVVVAADVFMYFQDLTATFHLVSKLLSSSSHGYFIFTIEDMFQNCHLNKTIDTSIINDIEMQEKSYVLQASGRFGHHVQHILALADAVQFDVILTECQIPRYDKTQPIYGYLFVFKRRIAVSN